MLWLPPPVNPAEVTNYRTELDVPRACISYIVGKQYENIAQLERTSGAQIFPVEPAPGDDPSMILIVFTGSEQAVRTARVDFWQVIAQALSRIRIFENDTGRI